MIWTYDNGPLKEIKADMKHVRNSVALDLKVRYTLSLKEDGATPVVITYHPKRLEGDSVGYKITSFFEDFSLYKDNEMILDKTYNAQDCNGLERLRNEDGAYRYILPDNCNSTFSWRYYYKGKTYEGEFQANQTDQRTLYKREELIDMGQLAGNKILEGDFYCTKMVGTQLTGYVFPQDALELMLENTCIAIVFAVGQDVSDVPGKDYPYPSEIYSGTETATAKKCHGYAVALTNASTTPTMWCTSAYASKPTNTAGSNWNGYLNCQTIMHSTEYRNNPSNFPPVRLCAEYGNNAPLQMFAAPYNSSGWYLPSISQGMDIGYSYNNMDASFKCLDEINKINEKNNKPYIVSTYKIHFCFYL